jgi:hypothetical protein
MFCRRMGVWMDLLKSRFHKQIPLKTKTILQNRRNLGIVKIDY